MSSQGVSATVGKNIAALRAVRGLTQAKLAALSGVARPTIALLESGSANPTLHVMVSLGRALSVSLDELVSPPRPELSHFPATSLPERTRGNVTIRELLPDHLPGLALERMTLPAKARLAGSPHKAGTREYFTCERGVVRLVVSGEVLELHSGDVAAFPGDRAHSYANIGDGVAVGYSILWVDDVRAA